uniref:Ig-like domain-containing protein n=1 Tax=Lates calcarifer TaxID=8187 RepID=A0A4W6BUY8_LATCA
TKRVDQTPPVIIKKTGESVTSEIKCSHSIQNHDVILWYKQDEHGLKLLGYLNLDRLYPEDDVKGKISFDGDGSKQSSLTISSLLSNDGGVYFCAARYHSNTDSTQVNTKTLKSIPRVRQTR